MGSLGLPVSAGGVSQRARHDRGVLGFRHSEHAIVSTPLVGENPVFLFLFSGCFILQHDGNWFHTAAMGGDGDHEYHTN